MLYLLLLVSIFATNKIILSITLISLITLLIQKVRKLIYLQKGAKYGKKR